MSVAPEVPIETTVGQGTPRRPDIKDESEKDESVIDYVGSIDDTADEMSILL